MPAEHPPGGVHDLAGAGAAEPVRHQSGMLARGDEADLLAVGLVGRGQSERRRPRPHLVLPESADREQHSSQSLRPDVEEHVRLIAGPVEAAAESGAVGPMIEAGIVPRGDGRRPDRVGVVEEPAKLDPRVAPHAGVGRAPTAIVRREGIDDPVEVGRQVERVERDAEPVGHAAGVEGVGGAAASLVAWPRRDHGERIGRLGGGQRGGRMPHEDADAVVARVNEQGSGHARVDAARHRHQDPRARGGHGHDHRCGVCKAHAISR